ncbi:large ribosomal subunit protein mL46 [Anolis carolinensis]|uniref:large ribosomal subunit protein mL46 n=1 Tax=Anolis carolinensis TaxID=28377 RepID=UPI002F2B6A99
MAAPFSRAAWLLLSAAVRSPPSRRCLSGASGPRWRLFGALCLQRLPLLTQALRPQEAEMAALVQQIEVEKSLYSDHEIRCLAEEERLRRRKDRNEEEDEDEPGKEIVLAQDLEDAWEQKLRSFNSASRTTDADKNNDRTSLSRKLDHSLLLLVKQKLGDQEIWLLPQTEWKDGETLRATAERALFALSGSPSGARFLGNAPCGVYKYKFPRAVRTEGNVGAKVFFFKAFLQDSHLPLDKEKRDYVWVSKGELADYLKPEYHSQVTRFFVDL